MRFFQRKRNKRQLQINEVCKDVPHSMKKAVKAAAARPVDLREVAKYAAKANEKDIRKAIANIQKISLADSKNLILGCIRGIQEHDGSLAVSLFEAYKNELNLETDERIIKQVVKLLNKSRRFFDAMDLIEKRQEVWALKLKNEISFRVAFSRDPTIVSDSERVDEYIENLKRVDPTLDEQEIRRHLFSLLKDIDPNTANHHGLLVTDYSDVKFHKVLFRRLIENNQRPEAQELVQKVVEKTGDDWFLKKISMLKASELIPKELLSLIEDPYEATDEKKMHAEVLDFLITKPPPEPVKYLFDKIYWKYRKLKIGAYAAEPVWEYLIKEKLLTMEILTRVSDLLQHHGRLRDALELLNSSNINSADHDSEDKNLRRKINSVQGMLEMLDGDMPTPTPKKGLKQLPKRVIYLLHNSLPYNSGGYATRTHGLLDGVRQNDWDVHAVSRYGYPWDRPQFKSEPEILENKIEGVPYHRLPANGDGYGSVPIRDYLKRYSQALVDKCESLQPTIIHGASNYMNGFAAVQAAKAIGIPSVYEVRGLWEITRISKQPDWKDTDFYRYMAYMEAWACKEADAVITITDALKTELIKRGVDGSKITIVHNGVHPQRFTPRVPDQELKSKLGLTDEVVIGYIGSIVSYEGLELLVEASGILEESNIDGFKFLIVGDGAVLDDLQALVIESKMEHRFIFTGRVPHEEVESYYSLIDIAPFPRISLPVTEMVSPLKPFEAMSMEKCVISSDVAALEEIVNDDETGLLFTKDDAKSLAEVLKRAIEDSELRERLGKTSRQWVIENRDWNLLSKKLTSIYEKLTTKKDLKTPSFRSCIQSSINQFKLSGPKTDIIHFLNKKSKAMKVVELNKFAPLPAILGEWNSIKNIDFAILPTKFVLKPQDGASNNGVFLIEKRKKLFFDYMRNKEFSEEQFIAEYYDELSRFKSINEPVMIEECLNDENPNNKIPFDYKFYCFFGQVIAIMQRNVNGGRQPTDWRYKYYDSNWNNLGIIHKSVTYDNDLKPPKHAAELIAVAERISAWIPIPFVRIDLYSTDKGVAFGEFTFHPGTYKNYTLEWDQKLGQAYEDSERRIKESGASLTDFIKEMGK